MGRDAEVTTISQRLSAAAAGHAGVVWIEGDAGFGKTALVRRVLAALPSDFIVMSAEADELAREQPFGVVSRLGAVTSAGSFAAGLELLRLTGERQDHRPVLVVVEDMHWADATSREALVTMARRLDAEPVALLLTSRPGGRDADGWDRIVNDEISCCTIQLGPMAEQQVGEWARRLDIELTGAQAARLHRHTGGHPLYIKTLLHELTPEQLTSSTHELPAPRSLSSATIAALAELPEEAHQLASALAVLGQRTPLAVVARVAAVTEPVAALESLLKTGFVQWLPGEHNTPIDFVHPLYRLAVYDDLSPTRRQALHRAAADNLGRVAGWPHRVAAADSADDALADELENGAADEMHRGANGLAAKYLMWAAPLTTQRQAADSRFLRGVRLLLADGQLERFAEVVPVIEACDPGPLRDLVLGSFAYETGDAESAQRLLSSAAAEEDADRFCARRRPHTVEQHLHHAGRTHATGPIGRGRTFARRRRRPDHPFRLGIAGIGRIQPQRRTRRPGRPGEAAARTTRRCRRRGRGTACGARIVAPIRGTNTFGHCRSARGDPAVQGGLLTAASTCRACLSGPGALRRRRLG